MLKHTIIGTLISALVIMMSGCGENPKPVITNLAAVNPIVVTLPKINPVTEKKLQFSDFNFKEPLHKLSTFDSYHVYKQSDTGVTYKKGLLVTKSNNILQFDYTNETTYEPSGRRIMKQNHTIFNVLFEIKDNVVTFKFPISSKKEIVSSLGTVPDSIGTNEELKNDVLNIFSQLKNISISKRYKLIGTINSDFPAQSIYANFKRMLGNYSYRSTEQITESKKQNTFNLNVKGTSVALYVEVFPYREGSKVTYSASIPYTISQNGSTLTKKDIDEIKVKISQIVND